MERAAAVYAHALALSPETLVSQDPDVVSTELGGHTVMMSIEVGRYFSLNPVAGRIWAMLERPKRLAEVCEALGREFDVDAEKCQREVLTFAQQLVERKLLRIEA